MGASGTALNVTISATDQATPTFKQLIAMFEQATNAAKMFDAQLTATQGKFRAQAFGSTQLFPDLSKQAAQLPKFSASLNQIGLDMNKLGTEIPQVNSKFAQFGQTLLQNGTAFGVAGASAFGLFNAIDDLEKVQLRAETATLRASTAQTTLAVAEKRLAEAKASGTATTAEIAILEAKVGDARERVAVTTERATILQQDYNEAIAGLALQVGPQAIALGGSLAQVYNTLGQSLKGAFTGVAAGSTEMTKLTGALGQMSVNVEKTNKGVGGLKGVLAGIGPAGFAAAAGVTALAGFLLDMGLDAIKAQQDIAKLNDELKNLEVGSTEAFKNVAQQKAIANNTIAAQISGFFVQNSPFGGAIPGSLFDEATKARFKMNLDKDVADLKVSISESMDSVRESAAFDFAKIADPKTFKALDDGLNRLKAFLIDTSKKNFADVASTFTTLDTMQPIAKQIDNLINSLPKLITQHKVDLSPWINDMNKQVTEGASDVFQALGKSFDLATTPSDVLDQAIKTLVGTMVQAKQITPEVGNAIAGMAMEMVKAVAAQEAQDKAIRATTTAFAGQAAAQNASLGAQQSFNDVIVSGIKGITDYTASVLERNDANMVATQHTFDTIKAETDLAVALTNVGQIYDGTAASFLAMEQARLKGVQNAQAFVTQTELEATATEASTKALQDFITIQEGVQIPPWLEVTPELLQAIQKEIAATGTAAGTLAKAMSDAVGPAFESISSALGEETLGKMKKAIKELPGFDDFSKSTKKNLLDIDESLFKSGKRFEEFQTAVNQATIGISTGGATGKTLADLMNQMRTDFESFSKVDTTGLTKVFDPVFKMLDSLSGTKARQVFPQFNQLINDIKEAFSSESSINADEATKIIQENIDVLEKFPAVFDAIKAALPPEVAAEIDKIEASMGKLGTTWSSLIEHAKPGQTLSFGTPGSSGARPLGTAPGGEDGAPEVPGPVKATDFDTKKQAIIDEVTKMWETNIIPPAQIPAPDAATFFTPAMTTIPTTATTTFVSTFNAGFGGGGGAAGAGGGGGSGLIIPAPNPQAFITGMAGAVLTAAQTALLINAAFTATLVIPAPDTTEFVNAMNTLLLIPADFTSRWNKAFAEGLIIPAPDLTEFADGLVSALEMVADFVTGTAELILLIPEAFIPIAEAAEEVFQFVVDTATQAIEDVVTATDDLITAFEDVADAGTTAGEDVSSAMEDITSAAEDATSAVEDLTSALENIPTDIQVNIQVNATGSGLQFLAHGYHGVVNEPTLFVVGEQGPERVDVEPVAGNINPMFAAQRGQPYGIETLEQSRIPSNLPPPYNEPPPYLPPQNQPTQVNANITIPVYLDGRHIETRQSQRMLRDLGALIT